MKKPVKKTKKRVITIVVAVLLVLVVAVAALILVVLSKTVWYKHPELKGDPEIGQWYRITPEGTQSSDGSEWHGLLKIGSENKVAVYFFGGGASINEYTSEHGKDFFATSAGYQDFVSLGGISSNSEDNPFKDWTFLVIPYATGDFHCGTGVYRYEDADGSKAVYHTGYRNYSAFLGAAQPYIGNPDTLLITGFSAGGFATSLLADDVIDRFPSAGNITVCVDSSLLLYDGWHDTAEKLWQAPTEITERLTGNNIVLDSLSALHEKRGNSVKILFDCSYRDDTLQQYQGYIRNGVMEKNKENGDIFQDDLARMVHDLKKNIPNIGIYIWNYAEDKETHNTQHTIISANAFDKLNGEKSIADWIYDAVNGEVYTYGLELLE